METWECFQAGISALRDNGWQTRQQKEIAEDLGYTTTHISQVFRGKRRAGPNLQSALAQEYGLHAEDVIKIGRLILSGEGFFPYIGEVDQLAPNSKEQAQKIISLTNRTIGVPDGVLSQYAPARLEDFLAGKITVGAFYRSYADELEILVNAVLKQAKGKG